MNLRFIDWIWQVRGSLALPPGQSRDHPFDRLDPLFRDAGTSKERTVDTLMFRKKDQPSQDKMSIFDGGVLRIEAGEGGMMLRYELTSRALLFCFLASLLFLAVAQATIVIAKYQQPTPAEAAKAEAKKKADAKKADVPMNPLDKALGAPAPEKHDKPGKASKSGKNKKAGKGDKDDENDKKLSPIPAYVFAGFFATLYAVGRVLEDRLVRRLFRKMLVAA